MFEELGVRLDGVISCRVSPITALMRVMKRGEREGGLDTIETALNRASMYEKHLPAMQRLLGGYLGAKVITIDTEALQPAEAAETAVKILEEFRGAESKTVIISDNLPRWQPDAKTIDEFKELIVENDTIKIEKKLASILLTSEQAVFVTNILSAQISEPSVSIDQLIGDEIMRGGLFGSEFSYLPKARQRFVTMIKDQVIASLEHSAVSLVEEVGLREATGRAQEDAISDVLEEMLACLKILESHQKLCGTVSSFDKLVNSEIDANKVDLKFIEAYMREAGILQADITIEQLMRVQPLYWNILTSSKIFSSRDANYQKQINGQPNRHHSLAPPLFLPRKMSANSMGEYRPFIEAVSTNTRAGFDTSLGFLHVVGIDDKGTGFQIEWPILMYDAALAEHPNALLRTLLKRGERIYFNHDLWHNLVPVYSEGFNLYHPHAPIAYGGIMDSYKKFGSDLRSEKEEYEIAVAQAHASSQQYRIENDTDFAEEQIGAALSVLDDLPILKMQLCASDGTEFAARVVEYFATVTAARLLNILPPDHKVFTDIDARLKKNNFITLDVSIEDVVALLISQRMVLTSKEDRISFVQSLFKSDTVDRHDKEVLIKYLLENNANEKALYPPHIVAIIRKNPIVTDLVVATLKHDSIHAESGAQELFAALHAMGLGSVIEDRKPTRLTGMQALRWQAATAPQREQLKGHVEKVHGKNGIKFGNEIIDPRELPMRQFASLQTDNSTYGYRMWARSYGQELAGRVYNLLFEDGQSALKEERALLQIVHQYDGIKSSDDGMMVGQGIEMLDTLLDSLVSAEYTLDTGQLDTITAFAVAIESYSSSLSKELRDVVEHYRFIQQQEQTYQKFAGVNYGSERRALEASTMNLLTATKN